MKNLLLPYRFKRTGAILLAIDLLCFAVLIPLTKSHVGVETARTLTLLLEILFLAAFALIALSKERIEDEYVAALRSQTVTIVVYAFFLVQTLWAIGYYGSLAAGAGWHRETLLQLHFFFNEFNNLLLAILVYVLIFNFRMWRLRRKTENDETLKKPRR